MIFGGGAIYTADPAAGAWSRLPRQTAARHRGRGRRRRDRAVGSSLTSRVADLAGPQTERVDLRGRALLPGFQDAHVHPAFAGVTMIGCNLIGAATLDEAVSRIEAYAAAHPEKEWISGSGWRMEWFERGHAEPAPAGQAHRRQARVPAQPGRARRLGQHPGTRARRIRRPHPGSGRRQVRARAGRRAAGDRARGRGGPRRRVRAEADVRRAAGRAAARPAAPARSAGSPAWQDAIVGPYLGSQDPLPVYLAAARSGQLTARVRGALWWDRSRGADQIDEIRGRREAGQAGRFRANTVKIMQDGVAENFTAGMLEPYLDACGCQTTGRGLSHVDPDELRAHVTALDALGFQVHFHAIGDRAVRECLDAVAAARAANGATTTGTTSRHLQVVHPTTCRDSPSSA